MCEIIFLARQYIFDHLSLRRTLVLLYVDGSFTEAEMVT